MYTGPDAELYEIIKPFIVESIFCFAPSLSFLTVTFVLNDKQIKEIQPFSKQVQRLGHGHRAHTVPSSDTWFHVSPTIHDLRKATVRSSTWFNISFGATSICFSSESR